MNDRDGFRVLTQHRWLAVGCVVEWQQMGRVEEEQQGEKQKVSVKNEKDRPLGDLLPW